jgi:hypothetical protein
VKTLAQDDTVAEIMARLDALEAGSTARWGRMSAPQMVRHLIDSARVAFGEVTVSDVSNPLQRTVIKWIALYAPMKWPPDIKTRPELDQVLGHGSAPGDFKADVAELAAITRRLAAHPRDAQWARHPIFGTMTHAEWLRWAYLHTDHHLRQFGG